MNWLALKNKNKILLIIKQLVSQGTEIKISIGEEKTVFYSKFIRLDQTDVLLETKAMPLMIIDKLFPEKGNAMIQSIVHVDVEFIIKESLCRCMHKYLGISPPPCIGFLVTFPEKVYIAEKRKEERVACNIPEFISVQFRMGKSLKKSKRYELAVLDCTEHGFGLLITRKDFDLLQMLQKGDKIENIAFFASWTMINVKGTVKHVTKFVEGKYKGCYLLGIESPDIIESCKWKYLE